MSKELEKVISKLSQKSKAKVEAEKKLAEKKAELEKVKEEVDQDEEDLKTLTEDQPEESKAETIEAPQLPKLDELEQQVMRLRDDGIYRVELLYQLQQINEFLGKLVGGDDGEKEE